MEKKHFIATHTCFTEEARRMYIDLTKGLTHAEMLEFCKKEKAEMLSQWMGADDFFIVIGMPKVKMRYTRF